MKKIVLLLCVCILTITARGGTIEDWDTPLRGVMISQHISIDDLVILKQWNVNLVRWQLRWNDFPKSPADNATGEEYDRWLADALDYFDKMLPLLEQYKIKVVLDLHTPPGGRNHPGSTCKIFTDVNFQKQFLTVWEMLANRYKGNPNIVAYDLLNEPVIPEKYPAGIKDWRQLAEDTIRMIRKIDPDMPIVFENYQWAIPNTLTNYQPLNFKDIIYSVHFYYPYEVAFQGLGNRPTGVKYPNKDWNIKKLEEVLQPVIDLQKKHKVRIFIGEFSCIRWAPEETGYNLLHDMITLFEKHQWPWTYHAFREWSGWSVEHSHNPAEKERTVEPTRRQKLLMEYFAKNKK